MSLRVLDSEGVNLVEQPPAQQSIRVSSAAGARASVNCTIIEDAALPFDYVNGTLHWNDGSLPVVYSGTYAGTLVVSEQRTLKPGDYVVRLDAHNYRTPVRDEVTVNFGFKIEPRQALSDKPPILYGPILPKDNGYPNADQWNWDTGTDVAVLASSVKMLLLTSKGERIMQPDYGTNIRQIVFELKSSGIESVIQNEITTALSKYEPRAALQTLSVSWTNAREVTVNATFASRLNQTTFEIPMTYTQ